VSELYADLAIPVSVDRLFTYLVPDELHQSVRCGMRALAPFGRRTVAGVIMGLGPSPGSAEDGSAPEGRFKYIRELLDLEPILTEDLLNLSRWIAKYYCAPLGEVLRSVLSVNAARSGKRYASLCRPDVGAILAELSTARAQASIVRELSSRGKTAVSRLQTLLGRGRISPALNALAARGIIKVEEEIRSAGHAPQTEPVIRINEERRAQWSRWLSESPAGNPVRGLERQKAIISELLAAEAGEVMVRAQSVLEKTGASRPTLRLLERKGLLSVERREVSRMPGYDLYPSSLGAQQIVLNSDQREAIGRIGSSVAGGEFKTFLLFGVTGSGKTQVYIEAIRSVLGLGKSVIVLVPEISLTPQIVRRFKHQFGERVVAQHSRMSAGERYDVWRAARKGEVSIVIGPRSAIFSPLKNLGLVVVDEEQDPSYKQYDQSPHYHARDVAIMRAWFTNAVVILGSATPSFESYSNALRGKYELLRLPERVDNARLPHIEIVDMSGERKARFAAFRADRKSDFVRDPVGAKLHPRKFNMGSLSALLKEKIADRLRKKEGTIILQNRRGFSPFIECYSCGYVELCPNCSISMTYHAPERNLRCHYCNAAKPAPDSCPKCASTDLEFRGFGTQRVEQELRELFPGATLLRMDRDTTTGRNAHDLILRKFSEGEADILLGTQMVAKGLDFSRVTLVGVISADTQMLLPDFRASEQTFQLLAQVAGRAGRSKLPGEVIIQTYLPGHPTLRHVVMHDFNSFYESEIGFRRQLAYPPFSRLVLIEFKGEEEREVLRRAAGVAESLRRHRRHLITLGPATPPIARLKGLFRCHVLMKDLKDPDPSGHAFRRALSEALLEYEKTAGGKNRSVKMTVDVDPAGMM
jgi:primosomal protein N' (replication factor Y) (superfamily II helicase)